MSHSSSVGACDRCGAIKPLVENDVCQDCLESYKAFDVLVDRIVAFTKELKAEGYTTSQILGGLESAGEVFKADQLDRSSS